MDVSEPGGQIVKNRKTGLVVFGVMEILIGCLCLLFCGLILAVNLVGRGSAAAAGAMPSKASMAMSLGLYGGLTIFFIWMGLGTIKGRRWARALMLIASVCWLVAGTLTTLFLAIVMPHMITAAMGGSGAAMTGKAAAGATVAAMALVISFMALFMVILPGVLFLFYRSPHVKATCERMDPKERWTDHAPLAVLALSLLLALGGTYLFFMLAAPAVPLFGYPLKGPLAILAMLVMAVAMWVLAVNVYRRRRWAWTATLALTMLGYLSSLITFWRMDAGQLMETAGVRSTPANAQAFAAMIGPMEIMIAVSMVIWLAYLLHVLRYFKRTAAPAAAVSAQSESQEP